MPGDGTEEQVNTPWLTLTFHSRQKEETFSLHTCPRTCETQGSWRRRAGQGVLSSCTTRILYSWPAVTPGRDPHSHYPQAQAPAVHSVRQTHSWTSNAFSRPVEELLPYIPACCCITLSGLLRVFLQGFGDKEYSKKYLCLLITTSPLFCFVFLMTKRKKMKDYRNYVYNIRTCVCYHSLYLEPTICWWSKFNKSICIGYSESKSPIYFRGNIQQVQRAQ